MMRTLARLSLILAGLAVLCHTEAQALVCGVVAGTCNSICLVSTACCNGCYDQKTNTQSCDSCSTTGGGGGGGGCGFQHCKTPTQSSELTPTTTPEFATTTGLGIAPSAGKACVLPPATLDALLGIKTEPGAFVAKVDPGGPASDAGLALCDLVVAFNNEGDLRGYGDHRAFRSAIREAAMFSGAHLEYWKFDAASDTYRLSSTQFRVPAKFGAVEGLATTFQVMVVDVPEGSAAAAAGVRAWDFIYAVNGARVSNMSNVIELDGKISDALAHDGKVQLTLGRWKPLAPSSEQKTELTLREVTFMPRGSGGSGH